MQLLLVAVDLPVFDVLQLLLLVQLVRQPLLLEVLHRSWVVVPGPTLCLQQ